MVKIGQDVSLSMAQNRFVSFCVCARFHVGGSAKQSYCYIVTFPSLAVKSQH